MTISYNRDIPDGPNNPSNDQPKMKTNTNSIDNWTAIDHVRFSDSPAGTHKFVHFPSYTGPTVINGTATQGSVIFSAAGTADIAHAQILCQIPNVNLPMTAIRAFGSFIVDITTVGYINQFNCNPIIAITGGSPFIATVNLAALCTTGTTFVVIPQLSISNLPLSYAILANQIVFNINSGSTNPILSFIVLQF